MNKLSRETIEESLSKASYPNLCVELLSEFREFLKPRSLNSLKPKKRRTERGSFEYNDEVQWMPEQGRAGLLETGALENDFEIPRAQDEIEYQSDIDMFSNQESLTFLGREIGSGKIQRLM